MIGFGTALDKDMIKQRCDQKGCDQAETNIHRHGESRKMCKQNKILIIQNTPLRLHALANRLQRHGFIVYQVDCWKRVPALLQRVQPDLVLVDGIMAAGTTNEWPLRIQQNIDTPVIRLLLTAKEEKMKFGSAEKYGLDGCIPEDLPHAELGETIKAHLEGSHSPETLKKEVR